MLRFRKAGRSGNCLSQSVWLAGTAVLLARRQSASFVRGSKILEWRETRRITSENGSARTRSAGIKRGYSRARVRALSSLVHPRNFISFHFRRILAAVFEANDRQRRASTKRRRVSLSSLKYRAAFTSPYVIVPPRELYAREKHCRSLGVL